jgi:hypothetical protein
MRMMWKVVVAMVAMTGLAAAQAKAPETKPAEQKPGGMMKPPAEIADMAKMASGTWRCKGQGMDSSMKMADMTATMKMKTTLNGFWVHSMFDSKMGKEPYTFEAFTTFDPSTKKWKRLTVDNAGGWATGESAGLKDGKVEWESAWHSPMMGDATFRDHEDLSDPKAGVKMWGEISMDKGKTWNKVYEMSCKK